MSLGQLIPAGPEQGRRDDRSRRPPPGFMLCSGLFLGGEGPYRAVTGDAV
jgi:hypothetical protein